VPVASKTKAKKHKKEGGKWREESQREDEKHLTAEQEVVVYTAIQA
jgi:hypothetical protein